MSAIALGRSIVFSCRRHRRKIALPARRRGAPGPCAPEIGPHRFSGWASKDARVWGNGPGFARAFLPRSPERSRASPWTISRPTLPMYIPSHLTIGTIRQFLPPSGPAAGRETSQPGGSTRYPPISGAMEFDVKEHQNTTGPIAVLLALMIGLCGCFSYGVTKKLIDYRDGSRRGASSKSDPYYTEAYLKYHRDSLALLGKKVSFARVLTTDKDDAGYQEALIAANEELAVSVKVYKNFESLSLLDRNGTVLASSEKKDVGLLKKSASVRAETDNRDRPLDVCAFVSDEDESFAVLVPVRVADNMVGIVVGRLAMVDSY